MRKRTEKKLKGLWTGEGTATVMFLVLWIIFPMSVEGTGPYMQRTGQSALKPSWLKLFQVFKWVNLGLIAIGLLAFVYQILTFPQGVYCFLFVYGFAIVEHINYYHIRLSYQTPEEIKEFTRQKGFRSSILAKELRRKAM